MRAAIDPCLQDAALGCATARSRARRRSPERRTPGSTSRPSATAIQPGRDPSADDPHKRSSWPRVFSLAAGLRHAATVHALCHGLSKIEHEPICEGARAARRHECVAGALGRREIMVAVIRHAAEDGVTQTPHRPCSHDQSIGRPDSIRTESRLRSAGTGIDRPDRARSQTNGRSPASASGGRRSFRCGSPPPAAAYAAPRRRPP